MLDETACAAVAQRFKPLVDQALRRFAGQPATPEIARKVEREIARLVRANPVACQALGAFAPSVVFDRGQPHVFFLAKPATANDNRAAA